LWLPDECKKFRGSLFHEAAQILDFRHDFVDCRWAVTCAPKTAIASDNRRVCNA
jgi:hypothetical protein